MTARISGVKNSLKNSKETKFILETHRSTQGGRRILKASVYLSNR